MLIQDLQRKGLISPPPWLPTNTQYLTVMGSHAYGVADTSTKGSMPDLDIYGFCVPKREIVFPHLTGEIPGFGTPSPRFEQWNQPHIVDKEANSGHGQEYDFQIFSIIKFFDLARQGNPNILDSLFTREECVLHCTVMGRTVRDHRRLFISKQVWPRMRGYAFSQMHKMRDRNFNGANILAEILAFEQEHGISRKTSFATIQAAITDASNIPDGLRHLDAAQLQSYHNLYQQGMDASRRFEIHKFHGYDCKFAYHIVRLLDQCEQILQHGEMDLQRAKETMKSIRRGEWEMDDIMKWASEKEKELDVAFTNCTLPDKANETKLKSLLLSCLEEHYGTIETAVNVDNWALDALNDIDDILQKNRSRLYKHEPPKTAPWYRMVFRPKS